MYQTDVIIYGDDLLDYVQHKFGSQNMASSWLNAHGPEPWPLFAFDMDLESSTMRFGRPAIGRQLARWNSIRYFPRAFLDVCSGVVQPVVKDAHQRSTEHFTVGRSG
ncbi:hypothetical protein IWX88_002463 [Frigoribacterium sp. CG_9.8]|nr:hypothetical protein [Frigoribacterium sp. CG_9.8]